MSAPALIACAGVALALGLPVAAAGAALEAAQRAAGAADAAALAAADAASGWIQAEPCTLAKVVAESYGAALDSCEIEVQTGQVRVQVHVSTMLSTAPAHARAGPSRAKF